MYIDEKAPGEIQITKLSQAIRIGALTVPEDTTWRGCALATAGEAIGWKRKHGIQNLWDRLQQMSGLSITELMMLSHHHCCGATRLQIATWLEARGL